MRKIILALALMAVSAGSLANTEFKKGQKLDLKDGGSVCRTLDGAIAMRDVVITDQQGGKLDMLAATRNYSCLSYSIRPLTFVK